MTKLVIETDCQLLEVVYNNVSREARSTAPLLRCRGAGSISGAESVRRGRGVDNLEKQADAVNQDVADDDPDDPGGCLRRLLLAGGHTHNEGDDKQQRRHYRDNGKGRVIQLCDDAFDVRAQGADVRAGIEGAGHVEYGSKPHCPSGHFHTGFTLFRQFQSNLVPQANGRIFGALQKFQLLFSFRKALILQGFLLFLLAKSNKNDPVSNTKIFVLETGSFNILNDILQKKRAGILLSLPAHNDVR